MIIIAFADDTFLALADAKPQFHYFVDKMVKQLYLLTSFFVVPFCCVSQQSQDTCINVFFKINSFKLENQQHNQIRTFIRLYPNVTQIIGFADTTGKANHNLVLSQQRAFAVYNVFNGDFDSSDSKIVTYYGESQDLSELRMNRRVQICAHKPASLTITPNTSAKVGDTVLKIELNNLYFLPDKPILSQESLPYIEDAAKKLKAYPAGFFHIVGHINYQSRFDSSHLQDLYELSALRAKAVYEYLIEFGIPANKMSYKGVGNSQPVIVSPKSDEERKRNMRVQIFIIR
jgi:outer membrane protein OmpA-like peptidoglycan-associated protein